MKKRKLVISIASIAWVSVLVFFGPLCSAQQAILTIKNVDVQLVETRGPIEDKMIHIYNITATLHNTGDIKSDEISVYLHASVTNTTNIPIKLTPSNISLNPDEMITFSLQKWPTTSVGDIRLNISFRPSAKEAIITNTNSGFYIYTLHIGNDDKSSSTPGFEMLIVLVAFVILLLKKKIEK